MEQIETRQIPVDIKQVDEPWTIIELKDGSIIRMRSIVMGVFAIYDSEGNHIKGPDGELLYAVARSDVFKTISSPIILASTRNIKHGPAN